MSVEDAKTAWKAIRSKISKYNLMSQYYGGNQPTVYLTERVKEIFKGVSANFVENWCAVIIDATRERIQMKEWSGKNAAAVKALNDAWDELQLGLEAKDIHLATLVFGESYLIMGEYDDQGETKLEAYFNDPRFVHVFYDPMHPKQKKYAAKVFVGDVDGLLHMTLYYRDHFEYWRSTKKAENITEEEKAEFVPDTDVTPDGLADNDRLEIPVFHFRADRDGTSDLSNATSIQNGINKLLSDMMVAAEYGAFRQRWIISDSELQGKLDARPGGLWQIPPGDGETQSVTVGEFDAADLNNYLNAIGQLATSLGVITRTPKHYFFAQSGVPSGEALIAMEAPLNKKAQDRIDRFVAVWREFGIFLLKVKGIEIVANEIEPVFEKPETVQPKTAAEITKTRTESQVPLVTALRWEGKSEAEIEQMQKDKDEEDAASKKSLADAMLEQQRQFDQGKVSQNANQDGPSGIPGTPSDMQQ